MNTVHLVRDVQSLIDLYGAENVRKTVDFIVSINNHDLRDVANNYWVAPSGYTVALSDNQIATLRGVWNSGSKIQAIKELRELTGCGLKDAKELIEYYFDGRRDF